MKLKLFTKDGLSNGTVELSDDIFTVAWKPTLVKQVILSFLANARIAYAHTKGRGEVRGGGKKPWKQKGTGRARHGSIRSPIWVGGGVAHGPRNEKNYGKKVNKKMRKTALFSALSKKLNDNELFAVDTLKFDEPKARLAKEFLSNLSKDSDLNKLGHKKQNAALLVLPESDKNIEKSFSNFGNVEVKDAAKINVYDVAKYKFVFLLNPKSVEEKLLARLGK